MGHQCSDCRDGEHQDLTDTRLCVVVDPDTHRVIFRGYLCDDHVAVRLDDGFEVHVAKTARLEPGRDEERRR